MTLNRKKMIVIFSVLVIALFLTGCAARGPRAEKSALPQPAGAPVTKTTEPATAEEPAAPAPATGDADETVKALLQDSTTEATASQDETTDAALIDSDSQAISDFGQSYGEDKL